MTADTVSPAAASRLGKHLEQQADGELIATATGLLTPTERPLLARGRFDWLAAQPSGPLGDMAMLTRPLFKSVR